MCNVTRREFEQLKADVQALQEKLTRVHTTAYNALQAIRRANGCRD